jgi:hypothetical protein
MGILPDIPLLPLRLKNRNEVKRASYIGMDPVSIGKLERSSRPILVHCPNEDGMVPEKELSPMDRNARVVISPISLQKDPEKEFLWIDMPSILVILPNSLGNDPEKWLARSIRSLMPVIT